jgi:hypothetical protein
MELEIDAESNRIEAAGMVTFSAGEIRPRGGSSSSRRRSGIRRAEALLTGEEGGVPQPRRPRDNLDLCAPALPRLWRISPAPPLSDPRRETRACPARGAAPPPPDRVRKLSRRRPPRVCASASTSAALPAVGSGGGRESGRRAGVGRRREKNGWAEDPRNA